MTPFAFVFPGQGSQSVGMLDGWGDHPAVALALQEASDALGEDLGQLIRQGPKDALALTTNTQPVMLVAGVAAWLVWKAEGGRDPALLAGHSLGEYSALVAAGVLTLAQAAPLVRLRAAAMQEAVPVGTGAMAAVLGLPAQQVRDICQQVMQTLQQSGGQEVAEAVNFNDPGQTVIAGTKAGIEAAAEQLKAAGAKRVLPLPVSAPFHSSLMKPAADKLREALEATPLQAPAIPVIHNIDVDVATTAQAIRDALYRQAFGPVRWVETVQAMQQRGMRHILECGPGKVLTGMVKRIAPELEGPSIYDLPSLQAAKEFLS
ncbi:ACP S-malonyltransferase [Lampropedia cohaerens]|uniref:Malonyl CoA-acyl carrier protein transacylase n=1 Tax=Lampropedia cohaerens TaxID=1610491 RepID=A0A0U1PZ79_9BURK|nr:ACP S-malonyltransferase [Lampropedia cohaerens]KKW67786.1 ACP S-malonyltransferase [Lampropedia cohaerens]